MSCKNKQIIPNYFGAKNTTLCVDVLNTTKIAVSFLHGRGVKTEKYLIRRNVIILPYNANFPVETIE